MPRATPLSPDARRAALVAATGPLLAEHGRDVSTRQIAEAAGVAEGTIFRVFPTKEALIDACLEEAFDVRHTCDVLAAIDPALPLGERVVAAVQALQDRLRRVIALFHALRLGPPAPREAADQHERQRRDNELVTTALVLVLTPDAGRLRVPVADAAALLRTVTFALTHPLLNDERLSEPHQIADLVLHGVVASPQEPSC